MCSGFGERTAFEPLKALLSVGSFEIGKDLLTGTFDIEEIDIVGSSVNHGPESHRVGNLTMEPNVFVCRECPAELGSNNTNNVSKHGKENETSVKGKDETCTTGGPNGPCQSIQSSKLGVDCL